MESLYTPAAVHSSLPFRSVLSVALFLLVVWTPWWLALIATLLLILFFATYELLYVGLFLDSLYATPSYHILHGIDFPHTALLLLCISISLFVRHVLRRI